MKHRGRSGNGRGSVIRGECIDHRHGNRRGVNRHGTGSDVSCCPYGDLNIVTVASSQGTCGCQRPDAGSHIVTETIICCIGDIVNIDDESFSCKNCRCASYSRDRYMRGQAVHHWHCWLGGKHNQLISRIGISGHHIAAAISNFCLHSISACRKRISIRNCQAPDSRNSINSDNCINLAVDCHVQRLTNPKICRTGNCRPGVTGCKNVDRWNGRYSGINHQLAKRRIGTDNRCAVINLRYDIVGGIGNQH